MRSPSRPDLRRPTLGKSSEVNCCGADRYHCVPPSRVQRRLVSGYDSVCRHLGNGHFKGRIRFRIHCRTASPDFDFAENGRRRAGRRTPEDGHDNSIPWCTVLSRRTESILRTVVRRNPRPLSAAANSRVRPSGIVTTIVTMGAYACAAATALSIATTSANATPPSLCFRMPLTPPSQGLGGDRHVADVATE